jgi:hypothetical protein
MDIRSKLARAAALVAVACAGLVGSVVTPSPASADPFQPNARNV